ncbi:hypothetical protein LCGC14_0238740 [marine sediment metagenome]|uniref:DUF2617 domain-containing protein n=1 Tax=marine sediment metagenome TaxID=412755 RepID=A0A0F9UPF7_9ZZZZ|nr:DUF2617 family protein [Phycisphaerae bacterium]HDZ42674.1 DUF2617 family protein [Phycisphaerae bacterium]
MAIGHQQRVASLRYYLYDRPLHPELFEIHSGERLARKHYEAQLWVTGCSHVIMFGRGKQWMVEVLADADSELPRRGLLAELPFRGEKEHEHVEAKGLRYMMNFQVETMSEQVFAKTHHDLARQGAKRGLFVPFPTWMRRPPLTPFSYLDYDAKTRHLHVFSYHAFPEDLTLVKVQSIFEVP